MRILLLMVIMFLAAYSACAELELRMQPVDARAFPRVRCRVLVRDAGGQSVVGLGREQFRVLEDDMSVETYRVTGQLDDTGRIAVALVIDHSDSMSGQPIVRAHQAVMAFCSRLSADDLLLVIPFGSTVRPHASPGTAHEQALASLAAETARGKTALYDAVHAAIGELPAEPELRKAIIVLTDGYDTASHCSSSALLAAAGQTDVVIYTVGLGKQANVTVLRQLADRTGGRAFTGATPDDLSSIYQRIATELQGSYTVAYQTPQADRRHSWRTLAISVTVRGQTAHATRQYLPPNVVLPADRHAQYLRLLAGLLMLLNIVLLAAVLLKQRHRTPTWHIPHK